MGETLLDRQITVKLREVCKAKPEKFW